MAEDKHIVFSYGRMNPPTAGHSKVVDKVKSHADKIGANHAVIVSHSQNSKTDPLHHEHKKEYLRHIHPEVNFEHSTKEHPHFLAQLKKFHQEGHTHATMVVGSDRVKQFKALANKYNGKEYNYKKIHILSAGQRDPDAEGVAGISGTKMRAHASGNDYKSFKAGLHANHSDEHAKKLYKATRQGMNLQKEERGMIDFQTFLAEEEIREKRGLWDNIHARRKKGLPPKKPGQKGYPKTLNIDEDMSGMTIKGGHKRSTESGAGLTAKGVAKYRRQNPGSKLKTAVTTPPSKLKPGSKAAKRRKSFCARSRGWTGERGKAARRRWNC
tara:strand:- start:307 stop:1284 length:978 start_codon:yes stop_codon:yes gene_type:complete